MKELLENAVLEIKSLRRENEILKARVEMFDDIMLLLRTTPLCPTYGMSIDVVSSLEKRIDELEIC